MGLPWMLLYLLTTSFLVGGQVKSESLFVRGGPYHVQMCGGTHVALVCDVFGATSHDYRLDASNSTILHHFKSEWVHDVRRINESYNQVYWIIESHPELEDLELFVQAFELDLPMLQLINESANCDYRLSHCSSCPETNVAEATTLSYSKTIYVQIIPFTLVLSMSLFLS